MYAHMKRISHVMPCARDSGGAITWFMRGYHPIFYFMEEDYFAFIFCCFVWNPNL